MRTHLLIITTEGDDPYAALAELFGITRAEVKKRIYRNIYAGSADTATIPEMSPTGICEHGVPFTFHCSKCSGDPR